MICTVYRTKLIDLLSALADPAMLGRYQDHLAVELPGLAEGTLVRHLKKLSGQAAIAQGMGIDHLASQDRAAADTLLSDVFAVATWCQWDLPIESEGEHDLPLEGLPRGLLAAEPDHDQGATLIMIDDNHVALARNRSASNQADLSGHPRA